MTRALLIGPSFRLPGGIQYVGHLMSRALESLYGSKLQLDIVSALEDDTPGLDQMVRNWHGCRGNKVRLIRELRRALNRDLDFIIVNHVNLIPYLGAAGFGMRRTPLMLVLHGIEAWRSLSTVRRFGIGRVSRLLFVSDFTRRRSGEANLVLRGIPGDVCHHGLLPDMASDHMVSAGPAVSPFVLMIGRMSSGEQYKGYEEMIRCWPLVERIRPDLRLILAGSGDDRPQLEALARNTSNSIEFVGQVSDPERDRLIRECAAFALPSRGEGFGLVYLEAMKVKKPVIAGELDAGAEVIVDGVTGRAVDAANQAALVEAVLQVTSPQGLTMGQMGYERFQKHFTFSSYVDRFQTQIEMLLPSSTSTGH